MFRKLRNRFVIINMLMISAILLTAFGAIYISSCRMSDARFDERGIPIHDMGTLRRHFGDDDFQVINKQRLDDAKQSLDELLLTLIVTGVITLVAVFGVSWYFAERSIRPIQQAWDQQRQFVADASHELKTPLSTIDANFDALLTDHKIKSKWTLNIKSELARMDKLVGDLLCLTRIEDSEESLEIAPFDLSRLVTNLMVSFETLAFEKGVKITSRIEDEIVVDGNAEKIRQIITLLNDNAVKYADKKVRISLERTKSGVVFAVENDGARISPEDLPHIFDRFYRADKSRNSAGYGLGLAIARAAAQKLGYKLVAKSTKHTTIFSLII